MLVPTLPRQAQNEIRVHTDQAKTPVFHRIVQSCPPGACTNCAGIRLVYVSFVKAGPFQYPPNTHQPVVYVKADGSEGGGPGGWFIVETRGYDCPVCQGENGRVHAAAA